ncbi:hypothetical protein ABZV77_11370 [Streptomyces sp. NPDC004732]|uniref:hypothetical protein n=1 Tax=Streptomyces sp. NPDC004732 TaxID=3154290 RepID=UPI0033A63107
MFTSKKKTIAHLRRIISSKDRTITAIESMNEILREECEHTRTNWKRESHEQLRRIENLHDELDISALEYGELEAAYETTLQRITDLEDEVPTRGTNGRFVSKAT